jgi:AraC-like DNA-binding protein
MLLNYLEVLKSNPEHFKQFSCKELLFLNYDCPVKEKKLTLWSEHNYFYYVVSGRKNLNTTTGSWELKSGSVVFIKRGACLIEQFFTEPFCIVAFIMPDSFISRFINANKNQLPRPRPHRNLEDLVIPVRTDEVLQGFYHSVLPFFSSRTQPSEQLIELKFNELLLNILNNDENGELISYMHEVASQKTGVLEHVMEANYPYRLELSEFASLCNRSLSTFKRDFENIYKTSPGKWLIDKRLDLAKQLLTNTDKQIADILLESGFENQSHFCKVFKAKFGCSPMKFRKQLERVSLAL